MKKYILLLSIFCLQLVPAKAQWVTIPDANFAAYLQTNYPFCMNGNQMDVILAQNISALYIYNLNITDLTGLEYCINLITLDCSTNQLTSLPALPNSLTSLSCYNNQLNSLPTLPSSLITLQCGNNQLSSIPVLPDSLIILGCGGNQLTYLPTLPSNLSELNCGQNQLINLPTLPSSMIILRCDNNQLTTLPSLPTTITDLDCSGNDLTIIPQLPNSLINFDCGGNYLTSIPTLPSSLESLICSGGGNILGFLPQLPNTLRQLWCEYNSLTTLPTLPDSLKDLLCRYNQLTSIPTVPNFMHNFYISNNNISCLSNLPQPIPLFLFQANISNNPLTCVPNQTNYSLGLPLCMDNDPINNPNYCTGVANITGYVYKDLDTNCSYANTDWNTENIPVKVYDGQNNMLAMSYTIDGAYSFTLLQPDTFVVKIDDAALPFSMDCGQTNNQNVALDSANQTIQNINFPVVCDTAYDDIKVNSVSSQGWVFPGQQHTINTNIIDNISWYNLNCSSINYSGTVSINITGPVTYVAPANNSLIPIVNGNTFTYNITDFSTLTPQSFGLQFLTDTTAQANDQICVHVEINPTPIDADTTNNVYDFCYQVVNSYDPNMKEVYPVNVLPGYDNWFTYTIHFQNTGNAPAFNIRLRDTLDANLDINTFEIRGYSHPAIVSINGNNLTVRFNNIMLPDSTTDYEGSMGYFQYRIKPLPNLPLGTQIENTAYIYFDYNAPIITNTTQNNFQTVVTTINRNDDTNQLKVFPNPANEVLNINLQNNNIENCIITNALGQTVYNSANEINGNHKIQLNISNLSVGVYFVKVRSSNGSYAAKFLKSE
jgi:Leucine-rich repeat (LRR) protein